MGSSDIPSKFISSSGSDSLFTISLLFSVVVTGLGFISGFCGDGDSRVFFLLLIV
jgi:hypothetical protein